MEEIEIEIDNKKAEDIQKETNKVLCAWLNNKMTEDRRKVLDTICKVSEEKRFWKTFAKIKCGNDNKIIEVKDTIEEINMLKNTKELMECKK